MALITCSYNSVPAQQCLAPNSPSDSRFSLSACQSHHILCTQRINGQQRKGGKDGGREEMVGEWREREKEERNEERNERGKEEGRKGGREGRREGGREGEQGGYLMSTATTWYFFENSVSW